VRKAKYKKHTPLKTSKSTYEDHFYNWLHKVRGIETGEFVGLAIYAEYKKYCEKNNITLKV
jgi:hypothetical protein